jgi:hypothetical protein
MHHVRIALSSAGLTFGRTTFVMVKGYVSLADADLSARHRVARPGLRLDQTAE